MLVLAMLLALDLDVTTFFLRRTRTTSTSDPAINVSSTWGNKPTRSTGSPCSDPTSESTPTKFPVPDMDVGGVVVPSLDAFPESSGDIPGECDGGGVPGRLDDRIAETTGNASFAGSGKGRLSDDASADADADGWVCGGN